MWGAPIVSLTKFQVRQWDQDSNAKVIDNGTFSLFFLDTHIEIQPAIDIPRNFTIVLARFQHRKSNWQKQKYASIRSARKFLFLKNDILEHVDVDVYIFLGLERATK